MTETELELMRIKMSLSILERLAIKTHILSSMSAGCTPDAAVQATLHSIALDDDTVRNLFQGLDSAQVGLRESEFREVVERMQSYARGIKSDLEKK